MTKEQALEKKLEQVKWQFPNHVVFKKNEKVYHFDPDKFDENSIFSQTGLKVFKEKDGNVALYDPEYFKIDLDGDFVYKGTATEKIPQPINLKSCFGSFYRCKCGTIDLSDWDFSEVTSIRYMFYRSDAKTIILGNADFAKCESFAHCFNGCYTLEELVLGNYKIPLEANVDGMLSDCSELRKRYRKPTEELTTIFKSGKWNTLQPRMEAF